MARRRPTRRREPITADTPLRVALYTRRSTDDEHQPYTIEAQTDRLTAYVASQPGWKITAHFTDDASGATMDRPGLAAALQAAEAKKYDLLLVYRLDRFSRRIRDLATLMDDLEDVGVHFRSATEPFDTASAAGRLFVQMLGAFAEFEREVIIDRVIAGMERKAANGEWTHGPRPYGYTIDPDTHRLIPHPEEHQVVTDTFTRYATTRAGTRAIAAQLNTEGKRTKAGHPFSGWTVHAMINNRLYLGETSFRDVVTTDAHEPLTDPATFDQCQRILNARGEPGSSRAASNSGYYLSGLITCPQCGCKYVGASATGKLRRYRYYTCFSRTRYGTAGCTAPRIDADLLDPAAVEALIAFYARTNLISAAIANEHTRRADDTAQHTAELETITGRITATQTAIDRYLAAFETGTLDDATCGTRIAALTTQLDQLTDRRAQLTDLIATPPQSVSTDTIEQIHQHLADILRTGTPGQRKAVMETHIAEIQFDGDRLIPVYRIPVDEFRTRVGVVGPAGLEPALSWT